MSELERKIEFIRPAWNKRDPDPKKDYGHGCVHLRFLLRGPKGAVTWLVLTGWYLDSTLEEWKKNGYTPSGPDGGAISYHSPVPVHDWQDKDYEGSCDVIPEGRCYSDASFIAGDDLFKLFVEKGEEAVWEKLEEWYNSELERQDDS
jgi:hypothetical protein